MIPFRFYLLLWLAVPFGSLASPDSRAQTLPRLFPDLVERYAVGDPAADNPISNTEGPKTIAAADLNADGLADIISGNLDGSVSVLLANPAGGLRDQQLIPAVGLLTNSSLRALAVADLNGDQFLDVAVADIAGQAVVVLLGDGQGGLLPLHRLVIGPARALAAADFNEDHHVDLLVACSPSDCERCYLFLSQASSDRFCAVLYGNGDGTFQPPRYLLPPGTPACFYDVAAADIDQDGHVDALALDFSRWNVVTNSIRHRRILGFLGDGAGGFTTGNPQFALETAGEGPRAFCLAYLDEVQSGATPPPPDARLDIVVANRDSRTLDVFINRGGLVFDAPISFPAGDTPRDVAAGDLDGDGLADLVVVNRNNNTLSVLMGEGEGRFAPPGVELPTGVSPRQIALADINGDGVLDAAVNNRVSEDVSVYWGRRGLGSFLISEAFYPAGLTPVSVVAADFDGDRLADLATANLRSHDVRVRLNQGGGDFGEEAIYPVNYQPAFIASGDVNGDEVVDLVVTCLGSGRATIAEQRAAIVTLVGRGDGAFEPPVATDFGSTAIQPYWLRLGDLSGDGLLDAVIGGVRGELVVFRGLVTGGFEPGIPIGLHPDGRPLGLALGDFDGDHWLDIACSRGQVFFNDGQFFDPAHSMARNETWAGRIGLFDSGYQAWAVEAEDLDEDGSVDLMVALTFENPDPIAVFYGRGDGTFLEPDVYEGPDVGAVALVGTDMDGDGRKDIVIGNRCMATVIILRGATDRHFEIREIIRTSSTEGVAVADLNGDDKPDLVGVGFGLWPLMNGGTNGLIAPRQAHGGGEPVRSGLFINELMALNREFLVLNQTTPDWIELYNHADITQSLAGWTLAQTTGDGEVLRFIFPAEATIGPRGHEVVYCKKGGGLGPEWYAPFELSSDGESLSLANAAGTEIDRVDFPPMPADVSFARFQDGARFFCYNPAPTLNSANLRPANLDPRVERKDPYVGPGASCLGLTGRAFDDVAIAYMAACYRTLGASGYIELPMSDDGAHGDKRAGDGYFGVILPPLPPGETIEYFLRVVDLEGQVDTSPNDVSVATQWHQVIVPNPNPSLRLTEVVAANLSGLRDERGQFEDWIELRNTGTAPVSLAGLALSKDYFTDLTLWRFPLGARLHPGQRMVVFCDGDIDEGPLHAPFKLFREGDRVFLLQADAPRTIIDSLSFAALPGDTSFGVVGAGTNAGWLAWPTPGAENIALPTRLNTICWRHFVSVIVGTNRWEFRWRGEPTDRPRMEYADRLGAWLPSPRWPVHLGEGLFEWMDPVRHRPGRFYRVRWE